MTEGPSQRFDPLPVAHIPEGDGPAAELRAELRMAQELLTVREARAGQGEPIAPPAASITHPRLACLGDQQLRDHIARLERDLSDVQRQTVSPQHCTLNGQLDYPDEEGER